MRPNDLHEWLRNRPFQPFRLVLSNGTVYEVRHPDLVLVGRSTLTIGTPAPEFPEPTYDRLVTVALVHINQIEPLPAVVPPVSS
jgi:hypothetical protein